MTTQPLENGKMIPTQTQPMMPTAGRQRTSVRKEQTNKAQPCKIQPLRTETAQISRRNSLRKQREAQKAKSLLK